MIATRVVDEDRVSAAVKSTHMTALNARLSTKQVCGFFMKRKRVVSDVTIDVVVGGGGVRGEREEK